MNHIGKALGWMIFRHSPWWAEGQSSGGLLVIEWNRTLKPAPSLSLFEASRKYGWVYTGE
jgi:hypothetical protein